MFDADKVAAILDRAAYYAWVLAWADHNDRLADQGNAEHVSVAGARLEDYAPSEPAESWLAEWNRETYGAGPKLAGWLVALLAAIEGPAPDYAAELVDAVRNPAPKRGRHVFGRPACRACLDIDDTASLGYYLAMECMGHGVSLSDDGGPSWGDIGRTFGMDRPRIEAPEWYGEPDASDHEHGAWLWVDGATATEASGCLDAMGYEASNDETDRSALLDLMRDGDVPLDDVSAWFAALYEASKARIDELFPSGV